MTKWESLKRGLRKQPTWCHFRDVLCEYEQICYKCCRCVLYSLLDCCFDLLDYVDATCLPHEFFVAISEAQWLICFLFPVIEYVNIRLKTMAYNASYESSYWWSIQKSWSCTGNYTLGLCVYILNRGLSSSQYWSGSRAFFVWFFWSAFWLIFSPVHGKCFQ